MNRRRAKQRGQAMVESSLVFFIFLLVAMGIFDIGQVLFVHQTLVQRAQNALRYGAVRPYDATVIQNLVLYNQPTAPESSAPDSDGDESSPLGFMGLSRSMVLVNRLDADLHEDRLTVTIQAYPIRFFTPLVAGLTQGKPIIAAIPYEGG